MLDPRCEALAVGEYFRLTFEPVDVERWTPKGLAISALSELAPGRFPGLDAICSGILDGTPFATAWA